MDATHVFFDLDGYGDMALWLHRPDLQPESLVRAFEVHPLVWDLLVQAVKANSGVMPAR